MLVYPKIAHDVMPIRAVFILEVYAYLVVAVTLKTRSLHFVPLTCSRHAGYIASKTKQGYANMSNRKSRYKEGDILPQTI